jgi:hypothetical protein
MASPHHLVGAFSLFDIRRALLVGVALSMSNAISPTVNAQELPIRGNFREVGANGDPCLDARIQREGDYISIEHHKIFFKTSYDQIVSIKNMGAGAYMMTMRSAHTKFKIPIVIANDKVSYQGSSFVRCR